MRLKIAAHEISKSEFAAPMFHNTLLSTQTFAETFALKAMFYEVARHRKFINICIENKILKMKK